MDLDTASRLRYLRVDETDVAKLRGVWDVIQAGLDGIMEKFYGHLATEPAVARFLDGASVEGLKEAQRKHWKLAFTSGFNTAYVESVSRIGAAHARIGMEPRWFLGAYALILGELRAVIMRNASWWRGDEESVCSAVVKLVACPSAHRVTPPSVPIQSASSGATKRAKMLSLTNPCSVVYRVMRPLSHCARPPP